MKRSSGSPLRESGWERPPKSKRYEMTLTVAMLDSSEWILVIDPWTTVHEIKKDLLDKTGIPIAEQHLVIGTVVLDSLTRLISHYTNKQHEHATLVRVGGNQSASSSSAQGGDAAAAAPDAGEEPAEGDDGAREEE